MSAVEVHTTCGQPVGRLPQAHIWHELDAIERRWCSTCKLNTSLWREVPTVEEIAPSSGALCCGTYQDTLRVHGSQCVQHPLTRQAERALQRWQAGGPLVDPAQDV